MMGKEKNRCRDGSVNKGELYLLAITVDEKAKMNETDTSEMMKKMSFRTVLISKRVNPFGLSVQKGCPR